MERNIGQRGLYWRNRSVTVKTTLLLLGVALVGGATEIFVDSLVPGDGTSTYVEGIPWTTVQEDDRDRTAATPVGPPRAIGIDSFRGHYVIFQAAPAVDNLSPTF